MDNSIQNKPAHHVFECGCECYDAGSDDAVTFSCSVCEVANDPVEQWFGRRVDVKKETIVINRCSTCGTSRNKRMFSDLPLVGYMDDGDGGQLELRNCDCGSTISIDVES